MSEFIDFGNRRFNTDGSETVYDEDGLELYTTRTDPVGFTHRQPEWVKEAIQEARESRTEASTDTSDGE